LPSGSCKREKKVREEALPLLGEVTLRYIRREEAEFVPHLPKENRKKNRENLCTLKKKKDIDPHMTVFPKGCLARLPLRLDWTN